MTAPPPQPPPGGWPPPGWRPPPRKSTGEIVGLAVVGVFVYFTVNFVLGFALWMVAGYPPKTAVFVTGAVVLALIAFGGGAGLLTLHKPWAKGLGLGLMIGWALTSLFTVGFCTGLNPELYHQGMR